MVISAGMKSLVAATVIVLLAAKSVAVETSLCTEVTVDGQAVVPDQNGYYNYQMVFDERRPFLYLVFNLTVHPQNDDGSQSFSLQSSDSYLKGYLENISNAAYIVCNVNDGQTCQLSYNFTEIISAAPTPSVIDQLFIISDALRLCYLNIETRAEADPVTLNLEWVHPMDTETFFQLKTTTSGYPRPITIDNELKCDGVVVEAQVLPKDVGFIIETETLRGRQMCSVTARNFQGAHTAVIDAPQLPEPLPPLSTLLSAPPSTSPPASQPSNDTAINWAVIFLAIVVVILVACLIIVVIVKVARTKDRGKLSFNVHVAEQGRVSSTTEASDEEPVPDHVPPPTSPELQTSGSLSSGFDEDEQDVTDGVPETSADNLSSSPSLADSASCATGEGVRGLRRGEEASAVYINNTTHVEPVLCSDIQVSHPSEEQKAQDLDERQTD